MAEGVASSLFVAAVGKASSLTAGELWNHLRQSAFDGDFDDPTQRFTARLRRKLADVAERRDLDGMADLVENEDWEELVEEFDESAVLTATSAEAEIEAVVEVIAETTDLDLSDPAREELKNAVGTATADALEWLEDEAVGTELGERWQLEREEALREEVIAEYRRVGRQAIREAFDLRDADREGLEAIAEQIEVEDVEFVPRPELEGEPRGQKVLLVGWAGAGKSRALKELLERLSESDHDFAHVVHPDEEEFLNTDQIAPLVNQAFEGDVLLVWDDIRKLDPENHSGTFQSTVNRLEGALNEDGHELHVLAAGRSGALDEVPPDGESPIEGPWSEFEPVVLGERGEDFLESLVEKAVEHYEVEASSEVERNLAEVAADVHPSPFYVTSVLEVAVDEGGVLTEALMAELPDESAKLWSRQNRKLRENHEDGHHLLRAIRFLSEFRIPRRKGMVEGTYKEVFDRDGFAEAIETLARKQWVSTYGDGSVTDDEARYYVHDVKLASVEEDDREKIPDFSEFLLEKVWVYLHEESGDEELVANGNFALTLHQEFPARFDPLAEEHYEHILDDENIPEDPRGHSNYGNLLAEQGRHEEAEAQYEAAIEADPEHASAHSNYGNLLQEQGRPEAAEAAYEAAIEADPEDAEAHSNYGVLLQEQGRYEAAEAEYEAAIAARDDFAEAHYNYAVLLKEQGRYEAAEAEYEAAIEADPEHAEAHYNYGNLLAEQGRYDAAEAEYEAAIEAAPEDASAHSNYAVLLKEQGRYEAAEAEYEAAIAARDDFAEAHYNYAVLLKEQGRYEAAEAEYEAAIEADPEHAEAHYNYAVLLKEQGRYDGAEAEYEAAIEADPEHAKAHYNYASLLHDQDEPKKAREHVETSVELWRQQGNTGNVLHDLRLLVRVCEDLDDVTAAIDNYILAFQLANRADDDFEDHVNWFGRRCLDHLEDGVPADVETTYDWALRAILALTGDVAFPLFEELWNVREDTDDDTTETLMTNAAAVAHAAHLDHGFESDGDDEPAEILQTVTPTQLPPSPKSLYDLLALDYPDVDLVPDDETDDIEPLHDAEDAAFGRLMALVT